MNYFHVFIGLMTIVLMGSYRQEDIMREFLQKRETTRSLLVERLVVIERQINRISIDISRDDCPGELILVNTVLHNDKEVLSQALNDLCLNGMPIAVKK